MSIEQASQPAHDVLGWSQPGLPGEASPAQQQVFPGFPVRQSAPRQSNETRAAAQAASGAMAQLVARLHGMEGVRSSNLLSSTMDTMCTGGEGRDPGLNAPTGYLGLKHNWLCTGVASRRVRVRVPPAPLPREMRVRIPPAMQPSPSAVHLEAARSAERAGSQL